MSVATNPVRRALFARRVVAKHATRTTQLIPARQNCALHTTAAIDLLHITIPIPVRSGISVIIAERINSEITARPGRPSGDALLVVADNTVTVFRITKTVCDPRRQVRRALIKFWSEPGGITGET